MRRTIASGRIIGAEALARGAHPELGGISPTEFIPIAEVDQTSAQLTRWIIGEALDTASRVHNRARDFVVSCNLDAATLGPRFDEFEKFLDETKHKNPELTKRLASEVPEAHVFDDQVIGQVEMLARRGFSIAIDDFGRQQSHLAAVARLRADTLKIDKSLADHFVEDNKQRPVVNPVIDLSHALKSCLD